MIARELAAVGGFKQNKNAAAISRNSFFRIAPPGVARTLRSFQSRAEGSNRFKAVGFGRNAVARAESGCW
jgi:hypothetical protein